MFLLVDNYDSFTFNLYQYLCELGVTVEVARNDAIRLADIESSPPEAIVLSPGPGRPEDAGISLDLVRTFAGRVPMLGVCLGHQCVGQAFGARVVRAPELRHGKTSLIYHDGLGVYEGIEDPFEAVRYHSLVVAREGLPATLKVSSQTSEGLIMGLRHRELPIEGVQFHPESILTAPGKHLLQNFLQSSHRSVLAAEGRLASR